MQVFKKVKSGKQEFVVAKVNVAIEMLNQNMRKSIISNINHEGVQKRIAQVNDGMQKIADTVYKTGDECEAVIDNYYYRILGIFKKMADHFDEDAKG